MPFESFIRSLGLQPREIVPGRWMRCPTESHPRKRNGSYKLAADGQIGWAMDFAIHTEPLTWRPEKFDAARIDRTEIARRKAAEQRAQRQATKEAIAYYEACEPLRNSHPYLEAKDLSMEGCYGLKRDRKTGALVVPMYRDDRVVSVQTIAENGLKLFWSGASTRGAHYWIQRPQAALTVLCEGLATGLTLFAAVPMSRVLVAFNAGNLINAPVPTGPCVVAADNDHETEARIGHNPGVKAATEAAQKFGCGVAVPHCSGADWNDYYSERLAVLIDAEANARRPRAASVLSREVLAEIRLAVMREVRLRA